MRNHNDDPFQTASNWLGRFALIWTGQTLSLVGSKLGGFALVWWLTLETGSATVLATASLALYIPRILLRPLAGALVDRWSRRLVIVVSDAFIALVSLWLAMMFLNGVLEIWHIYIVVAARAIGDAFHDPAFSASTVMFVPEKHLSRLTGINHMVSGGLNLVGPMLGALAISLMPLHGVMLIDVGTAAFAILPLLFLSIPQPDKTTTVRKTSVWRNMGEAVRYIRSLPGLTLMLLSSALGNGIVTPVGSFLPLYITNHFRGGAFHLASLQAASGAGYVVGGFLFTLWSGFPLKTMTIYTASAAQGLTLLLVALAPPGGIVFAVVGMFLGGITNTYYNAPSTPLFQANVPPELQGRVFSLSGTLCYAFYPLGLLIATPIVERFGVRPILLFGAAYLILSGGLAAVPSIRQLEVALRQTKGQ